MSNKIKTITLTFGHLNPKAEVGDKDIYIYRVEKVTDSVDFSPGDFLTKEKVNEICGWKEWKVAITQNS